MSKTIYIFDIIIIEKANYGTNTNYPHKMFTITMSQSVTVFAKSLIIVKFRHNRWSFFTKSSAFI